MTITDDLIEFTNVTPDPAAKAVMALSVLDWVACGRAGALEGTFGPFTIGEVEFGRGSCSVFCSEGTSPAVAALVNGTLSHALDFDDTHFAHIGHPSVAVMPAVLAAAEVCSNEAVPTLIDAALVGCEASVRTGMWLGRNHYQIGYHQTATAGAFGATIAVSRLLGLDDRQIRNALGLCSTMASGLKSQFGTMGKPLNAGLAARAGLEAAFWARDGMTSADDGLAGALGFGETHHGQNNTSTVGQTPWMMETVSHKFHACCHGLHAMLEALCTVKTPPNQIEAVEIRTHPRWMTVCNIQEPKTGLECKFSYKHAAAMRLNGIDTGDIGQFSDEMAASPEVSALAKMVSVIADQSLSEMQSIVTITTSSNVQKFTYDLSAPITLAQRQAKLLKKAAALLGQDEADEIWQACQGEDLKALTNLIRKAPRNFVPRR